MTIAIIGGGLSGTILAHYLLRSNRQGLSIYLFEREPEQLARGVAYRNSSDGELLNVTAARMNLCGVEPGDFYRWLKANVCADIASEDFVPRTFFGAYLKEFFQNSIAQATRASLQVITDEVVDLKKDVQEIQVFTNRNGVYNANRVVVANGILPPTDPFLITESVKKSGLYQSNPWNFRYRDELKNNSHVVLIGTGLTMLDHASSLLKADKNLNITAFSRRGMLPLPHCSYKSYDFPSYPVVPTEDIGTLVSAIRTYYKYHKDKGLDWRDLIDKIRTQVPQLWEALSSASRSRFIRHLKPYWEIHRHRVPVQILDRIQAAMREGKFSLLKGRIQWVERLDSGDLEIVIQNNKKIFTLRADFLLNSSGLQQNISLTSDVLLKNLLDRGYLIPDSNGLGVETDEYGALECKEGNKNIFTLGALRRAAVFECTAAKEIGGQAFLLSENLLKPLFEA